MSFIPLDVQKYDEHGGFMLEPSTQPTRGTPSSFNPSQKKD